MKRSYFLVFIYECVIKKNLHEMVLSAKYSMASARRASLRPHPGTVCLQSDNAHIQI